MAAPEDTASEASSPDLRAADFDNQIDLGFGDTFDDVQFFTAELGAHRDDEVGRWNQLPIDEKWEDVMSILQNQVVPCRWDATCGDSSVNNFLEGYKKEGLKIKDEREVRAGTALHMLAKHFDKNGFASLDQKAKQGIIRFLLDNGDCDQPTRLKIQEFEDPLFTVALRYDNKDFIKFVLSHCPETVESLLHSSDEDGTNTLHHLFKAHFPKAITDRNNKIGSKKLNLLYTYKLANSFTAIASAETIAAQDKYGNTPLHYALNYALCRIPTENHQKLVFQMINTADTFLRKDINKGNQFNFRQHPESPYLYFHRTKSEFLETLGRQRLSTSAAQTPRPRHPEEQELRTSNLESKTYNIKNDAASRVAEVDGRYHAGLEASIDTGLRQSTTREYVEKGLGAPFVLPHTARSAYDKQPPKSAPAEASNSIPTGTRNVDGLVRRPTFDVHRSRSFTAEDPKSVGQSLTIQTSLGVQGSTSSHADDLSKQQRKTFNIASTKSVQKSQQSSQASEEKENFKVAAERIRVRLKFHYIRTRTDIDAKDLLYGKIASDKNLYFDATDLEGRESSTMAGLINMLSQPGGFEDTLSYVYIPRLNQDEGKMADQDSTSKPPVANQGRQRTSKPDESLSKGRDSLVEVFDTLARVGVRNILHLQVDDMYENGLYHSDAAIERSIQGVDNPYLYTDVKRAEGSIDIETWNWMKPDLSIDVIRFAAPNVCMIHLYWSGNQAVLRGWACEKGIPGLYLDKGKNLKALVLHASPGIECTERTKRALKQFKTEIDDRTDGGVKVDVQDWAGNRATGSRADRQLRASAAGQQRVPPDHDWVKSMESFRRSLLSIHRSMPKEIQAKRIKVALIDDGVHLSSLNTYNDSVQVTGLSYWTPDFTVDGTFIGQSWHQSTRGHGTTMANMLVRVNPWVLLYVIRIQDLDDKNSIGTGPLKMHAESAAKAIRAAVIRDVDIITMSWTIRDVVVNPSLKAPDWREERSIKALKQAIEDARSKNIIMFCSAADEIKHKSTDSLPFAQAPNYIFRIGAAGPSGQRDMMSEDQQHIQWFFPGNEVLEAKDPRSANPPEPHSGSSVSTALAAGLASLVMYLPRLMQAYHEHTSGKDSDFASKFAAYAERLRKRENIRTAFDNITDQSHEDRKFLPVWHMFGRRADLLAESHKVIGTPNRSWGILEELVTDLCSKLTL